MIKSMTGFGRGKAENQQYAVTVEMKSVNHRFCEMNIRMPRQLMEIEDKVKKIIQTYIKRGRVEVFVTVSGEGMAPKKLQADFHLLDQYIQVLQGTKEKYKISDDIKLQDILHMTDVLTTIEEETDQTPIYDLVLQAVNQAVEQLVQMRQIEGEELQEDLFSHLNKISRLRDQIFQLAPSVSEQYKEKIKRKLQEYVNEMFDEQRVLTEVAIFADKSDINEELIRIQSHVSQFAKSMNEGDLVGRKLDFLVQELNREMNTIGAKANHGEIAQYVIEMKSELERIKEQVQNVE
ncbi:YicC/YloC family endoribonuclease [Bacillus sp. CGMCC 1.16541]|uniref:YicC/YloC family endoribonuclease n=1 Tax=Bacillus sp. CGMCC 1.16541 TaxID=2185143 RepID=UPI000D7259F8|nr:YicC/YloC family endoribonuclease [Bacillus sp. CGMCC 1.16541]